MPTPHRSSPDLAPPGPQAWAAARSRHHRRGAAWAALIVALALGGCGGASGSQAGARRGHQPSSADERGRPGRVDDAAVEDLEGNMQASTRTRPLVMTATRAERCAALLPLAQREARAVGLDPLLIMAIVWVESGFVADARSGAGAVGLMQLMERTGAAFGCEDREDEVCSLRAGAALMARLLQRFDGQTIYALCAYNAGSGRVSKAFQTGRLPLNQRYAEKVFEARARLVRDGCAPRR